MLRVVVTTSAAVRLAREADRRQVSRSRAAEALLAEHLGAGITWEPLPAGAPTTIIQVRIPVVLHEALRHARRTHQVGIGRIVEAALVRAPDPRPAPLDLR